jgi:4a-hydroxytetrahydrobiopterin dehydratase
MSPRKKLTADEIQARLADLPGWHLDGDRLHRRFQFPDFVAAFGFMTRAALIAERMNHHPDWSNVYNRVEVHLSTHDVGGLSALDFELAAHLDALFGGEG